MIRSALLEQVADLVPRTVRPVLVGIDGGDGAGKTWFADELAVVLRRRGIDVVRATVDDFHRPCADRHARGRTAETMWHDAFDLDALRRVLLDPWRAGAGHDYALRWHDVVADRPIEVVPVPVPEDAVLLVDGLFLLCAELRGAWDLTIHLRVTEHERVRRMSVRDGSPDDVAHPDLQRYLGAQRLYGRRADPVARADVVVDNTDLRQPWLIRGSGPETPAPT